MQIISYNSKGSKLNNSRETTKASSIFALDRARLSTEPSRPATRPMPSWGESWLQENKRPQLSNLDLRPLKHWREKLAWGSIPWKELVRLPSHPLHPSKWGIASIVELNGTWYTVFGPDESPLLAKLHMVRTVNYSPHSIERLRLFGGSLGNWKVFTYEGYWRNEIVNNPSQFVGVDEIVVGDQWSVKLPIMDFYQEGGLVGKMLITVNPDEAKELAQVELDAPIQLDLVLCNLWHKMGTNARKMYLSREDFLKYRIWTKLPIPEKVVKLNYHEKAPRYH